MSSTSPHAPAPPATEGEPDGDAVTQVIARAYDPRAQAEEWKAALAEARTNGRRGRLAYELARLHEGPLRDLDEAWAYYQRAVAALPDHLPSVRGARRVALARDDARAALALFDAEVRATADPRHKAALLYAKGRLLEDALGEPDAARDAYAVAAELDRNDPSILKALEQRELDGGDPAELERVYERTANAVASDPRHRAALVVTRARILEYREGRTEAALELYQTALRLDPHAGGALDAVERLCAEHGRHRELIRALEQRAEQSRDPVERAHALYRVARLHAARLGNEGEAIAALERAAATCDDDVLVLEDLANLYERAERYAELAAVLERLAALTSDASERRDTWHRIGQLHDERLRAPEDARRAYERALAIDPTHAPSLDALGRLYEAAGAWDALVAMHLAEAEAARDPSRRAAAHARAAAVLERAKGDEAGAIAQHARALALAPGYAPSQRALARLYAGADKHRELVELHERAVEREAQRRAPHIPREPLSASAAASIAHLFEIAATQERALGEHAQAASTYRRILALDPTNLTALRALQRTTERAHRYAELVDALEREAALREGDPEVVELFTRAGEILETELDDDAGATARYHRALELDPQCMAALRGLARIHRRAGHHEDLLDVHARELALDPKNTTLLHTMGEICETRLGDETRALAFYRDAIAIDPAHRPSLASLAKRLEARRDHAELARVLERQIEAARDPAARARAAFRAGLVYEEHLGASDRAAAAYELALAAVPGFVPAAEGLARTRAAQGAWRKLAEQLEDEAAHTNDEARAVAKLARAGELWERSLGDPRRAAACHERAVALSPRHLESLLALERLYTKLGRYAALAKTYGALARVLADPGARVAALRELARLLVARGARGTEELREVHEAILGLAPDDPLALEALEALALESADRALLERVDRRRVATAGDAKTAATYQVRLAESLEAAGDPAALGAYRAALESDPESAAAAKGLARMAARLGMPEAVVLAARREAAITPEPRIAARKLVLAAKVAYGELRDARTALDDFERALELWPDDADAAAGVEEVALALDDPARAADRLARAAASAKSPDRFAALWMHVARLQSDQLDDAAGALVSLGRVLQRMPAHVPALRRSAELCVRERRFHDAAAMLTKVVSLCTESDVLQAAHLELARVWAEHLGDAPRALLSLQAVLALDARHTEALLRLADVAERAGDAERAIRTLEELVEVARSPAERVAALLRLAEVQAGRGDRDGAERSACEALAIEGPSGTAAERHRALVAGPAGWEAHVGAIRAWLTTTDGGDGAAVCDAALEIARICREELKRPADALDVLERAAEANPSDLEVRRTLATTLRLASRHGEALTELRALLDDHPTRAELWRELSHTLRGAGDIDGARRALEPLLLLGSAHGEEIRDACARPRRVGRGRPGPLDASFFGARLFALRESPLSSLLRLVTPTLGKLYPPDPDALDLPSRDRAVVRAPALRPAADRVAAIFGAGAVHVALHRSRARPITVELGSPPIVAIAATLADLGEAHLTFAIACGMANIAAGLHAVDKLTPRELEIVLAAVARRVSPGFGAGLTSEEVLDDIHKRFYKALPRRARKDVEGAARAYVRASERDFAALTHAVVANARRIALLVADDLLAAVDVLRRVERDLAELSGARLLLHPSVRDLVRYWISPEADALRQRLGIGEASPSTPFPQARAPRASSA